MDPYKILGVSPDATDEEVKKAYKQLSKKYHPDANINNPNKEQAEEMFKNVQQAYQIIMKQRTGQGAYANMGGGSYSSASSTSDETDSYLQAALGYMRSGYYKEARTVLDGMSNRDSRWYFYSAQVHNAQGNKMEAIEHAKMAVGMEPGNMEYQMLLQMIERGGAWYETRSRQYHMPYDNGGGFCLKLCLLNFMCNLCCGGGGFCCGDPRYFGGPVA